VEEKRVAATAGEKCVRAGLDDVRLGAERDLGVGDDLRSHRLGRARFRPFRHEDVKGLPAGLRLRKYIAERNVGQVVTVGGDIDAIDRVGMKGVSFGVRVEDDDGPVVVGGRLEYVEIAEVKSLITKRRAKTESSEMVRHLTSPLKPRMGSRGLGTYTPWVEVT